MIILLQILLPVFGLVLLGAALRHCGFLDAIMESAFNRFCFYVSLPVFIALKVAESPELDPAALRSATALLVVTLCLCAAGILLSALLRLPLRSRGTFIQGGFRGNLAYVGLPVIAYALSGESAEIQAQGATLAILTMAPSVFFFNLLGVMALEWDRRHTHSGHPLRTWLRSTLRNPLILSCVLGLTWNALAVPVPDLLSRTLQPVGATAFPLALLAIGARIRSLSWRGAGLGLAGSILLKNFASLGFAWAVAHFMGLEGVPRLVLLVLSTTPTAVATFVLVDQMDGDRDLSATAIAGTTLASLFTLALALHLALS